MEWLEEDNKEDKLIFNYNNNNINNSINNSINSFKSINIDNDDININNNNNNNIYKVISELKEIRNHNSFL